MTAELPGLLPFRWEANDGKITPRRPEDDVEFGAAGAVAIDTGAPPGEILSEHTINPTNTC